MSLSLIDISIIVGYIVMTVLIGYFISRLAKKNMGSYFLGGNKIPWYILGVSNASGMFDITGTMWMVAIMFVYGVKSAWLPWMWPVWNQIFMMIFLAIWLRRSGVMTGAEWLKTRFGTGKGAIMSHLVVVAFALITVVGFIAYGSEGVGKFAQSFFPWDLSIHLGSFVIPSAKIYAVCIMALTTIYVVKGGMYSVVMTDIIQFLVMTISCLLVGYIAYTSVTPEQIQAVVPHGWSDITFGWNMDLNWTGKLELLNQKISDDGYDVFGAIFMMMVFKGILISIAGPTPGYDMQKVLACRTPKEAAKMSGLVSLVLFVPRYLMIAGLAVLALVYLDPSKLVSSTGALDFELVLPFAINNFVPVGIKGLLLAGLVAAFMSTFAANVNAGPAYIVNDIYKRFINPNGTPEQYMRLSYISSFAVVVVGILLGFFVTSIDSILRIITGALLGGYTAANFLKWIWWRMNGYGFFWGMASGIFVAFVSMMVFPDVEILYLFPAVFCISGGTSIIVSLLTPAEEDEVLIAFYRNVRPWGFWGPVYKKLVEQVPESKKNNHFLRDMFNCTVGALWQMTLVTLPIFFMIGESKSAWISFGAFVLTSVILKFNWLNKIEDYPEDTDVAKALKNN